MRDFFEFIKENVSIWIGTSIFFTAVFFFIGLADMDDVCSRPVKRIEVIAPWIQLGCWFGKPLKEQE